MTSPWSTLPARNPGVTRWKSWHLHLCTSASSMCENGIFTVRLWTQAHKVDTTMILGLGTHCSYFFHKTFWDQKVKKKKAKNCNCRDERDGYYFFSYIFWGTLTKGYHYKIMFILQVKTQRIATSKTFLTEEFILTLYRAKQLFQRQIKTWAWNISQSSASPAECCKGIL